MIEASYQLLSKIGYAHPAHPPLTHITIGLVVGAFIFCLVDLFSRRQNLIKTARHCLILALVVLFPTVLLGYMDWQHYYAGAMIFPIKMKLILAAILLVFLLIAVVGKQSGTRGARVGVMSFFCLLLVLAIGYFGGDIVYKDRVPAAELEPDLQAAAGLFTQTCGGCHPNGGNSIKPDLPLSKAPQMVDFNTFLAYVRAPKARDGSPTMMPPFAVQTISDEQMKDIYEYVTQVIVQE
jgi:mono/diheme cytochrome c family protein